MREPDAVDGARVLGLSLLAYVGLALLQTAGLPKPVLLFFLPAAFLGVPLLYARLSGLKAFSASGFRAPTIRTTVLVLLASLGSLWLLKGMADERSLDDWKKLGPLQAAWRRVDRQKKKFWEPVYDASYLQLLSNGTTTVVEYSGGSTGSALAFVSALCI